MSELLFKFLHLHDAHEALFDAYDQAIEQLCGDVLPQVVLRAFECSLLGEVGYGLQLDHDAASHRPVEEDAHYYYYPEKGPVKVQESDPDSGLIISGKTLRAISMRKFDDDQVMKESKQLLRMLLLRQVREGVFKTRQVYAQMLREQARRMGQE